MSTTVGDDGRARCSWSANDAEYRRYHDEEWGVPLHGDRELFEKISLEGFQAGLSWITILRRRPAFRELFHSFDIDLVALIPPAQVEVLMGDERIIRNRAKIEATITNAQIVQQLTADAPGTLDKLLWSYAPPPRAQRLDEFSQVATVTPESTAMSAALRKLGFRFVGPTMAYALMQSAGMVDDHFSGCWRA